MFRLDAVKVSLLITLRYTDVGCIQTEDAFAELCCVVAVDRTISTGNGILRVFAAVFALTVRQCDAELFCIVRWYTTDCLLTQRRQNGATVGRFRDWRIDGRGVDTCKIRNQLCAAEHTLMMMMMIDR